jgi:peptidoglycan hydrolase CwlO-like protein
VSNRGLKLLVLFAALTAALVCGADELRHVTDDELANEVQSRKSDIARTQARIATLKQSAHEASTEIALARTASNKIEALVIARTRLFYRLHRNGGSLRYLLGAPSATALLKRLGELRQLLGNGLDSRRQAGARLAQAEGKQVSLQQERETAQSMLLMLEQALDELVHEQARRGDSNTRLAAR